MLRPALDRGVIGRNQSSLPDVTTPLSILRAYYRHLPAPLRGMVLMFFAALAFATMHAIIRHMGSQHHPFEIAFFRNLFGFIVLLPFFARHGLAVLKTERLGLHAARGVTQVAGMLMFFTAVTITPLATIAALSFTAPLFATVGAILLLRERVRLRRIAALVLGFVGTMIVLRPGLVEIESGALLAVASSVAWATAMLIIKILARTESSVTITAYMAVFLTPMTFIAALFVWRWPSLVDIGWFALMGTIGTAGHLALAQAFKEADVTTVLPVDFTRLFWASAFGFFLFGQVPEALVWVGGSVIFASTLYIAYREARSAKSSFSGAGTPGARE